MSEDSGSDSSNDPSSGDSGSEALAANKNRSAEGERYQAAGGAQKPGNSKNTRRENAGIKNTSSPDSEPHEKSADKKSSGGNEVPSADEVSIPSSVDPDAPSNSTRDRSDTSSSSESSE